MALNFLAELVVSPFPVESRMAAAQAMHFMERAEALGGIPRLKNALLQAILNARPADDPSEVKRLRMLYQNVYSHAELTRLISSGLENLGITEEV